MLVVRREKQGKKTNFFFNLWVIYGYLCVHLSVCMFTTPVQEPEEGIRSHGTRLSEIGRCLVWVLGTDPGPRQEQLFLLTTKSSLQHQRLTSEKFNSEGLRRRRSGQSRKP